MSKTIEEILTPKPEVRPRHPSPKGACYESPGQRPGYESQKQTQALKGRSKHRQRTQIQNGFGRIGTPFQGFELLGCVVPRALPWAGMGRAVGAETTDGYAMSKTIEEILAPKPEARPRLYACSIDDQAHAGQLKVGQTTRDAPSQPQRGVLRKPRATPWVKHDKTNKALKGRPKTMNAHVHATPH